MAPTRCMDPEEDPIHLLNRDISNDKKQSTRDFENAVYLRARESKTVMNKMDNRSGGVTPCIAARKRKCLHGWIGI